jgi:hypothetical protein
MSLPYVATLAGFAGLLSNAQVPLWLRYATFLFLGFLLVRMKRHIPLIQFIMDEPKAGKLRLGSIVVDILDAPKLTLRRKGLLCLAFLIWFVALAAPLVIWFDAKNSYLILLPMGVVSLLLMIDRLEKRWQK